MPIIRPSCAHLNSQPKDVLIANVYSLQNARFHRYRNGMRSDSEAKTYKSLCTCNIEGRIKQSYELPHANMYSNIACLQKTADSTGHRTMQQKKKTTENRKWFSPEHSPFFVLRHSAAVQDDPGGRRNAGQAHHPILVLTQRTQPGHVVVVVVVNKYTRSHSHANTRTHMHVRLLPNPIKSCARSAFDVAPDA